MYNEKVGIIAFIVSFVGFNVLYLPYFYLLDMPRRVSTYSFGSGFGNENLLATVGAFIFGPAFLFAILNLVWSYRKSQPAGPNPWDAKEVEWTGDYSGESTSKLIDPSDEAGNVENSEQENEEVKS
jgi:cytochrome c oxidase subunit I+III